MDEIPISCDRGETDNIIDYEPIKIKQNEIEYNLNIKSKGDMITFSINIKNQLLYDNYIRKMRFHNIKELHKAFNNLKSYNNFYEYLKTLSDNEKLNIKKYNDKISLIIYLEVSSKQENIEIDLFIGKQDLDFNMQIISKEINNLKKENKKLNKEINNLKKENEKLKITIINLKKEEELNQKIKDKEINTKFVYIKNEISLSQTNTIVITIMIVLIVFFLSIMINESSINNLDKKIKEQKDQNKSSFLSNIFSKFFN
jgi:hypothetical protein